MKKIYLIGLFFYLGINMFNAQNSSMIFDINLGGTENTSSSPLSI